MHSKVATKTSNRSPRQPQSPNEPVSSSLTSSSSQHIPKSSESINKQKNSPSKSDQLRERVNNIQNSTAKAAIRIANQSQINQDPGIVDGYLENVIAFHHFNTVQKSLNIYFTFYSIEFGSIKNSITKCAYGHDNNSSKINSIFGCIS